MPPKFNGGKDARESLGKAERYAARWLDAHETAPDRATVLACLRELGTDWPTQARPNVTAEGGAVPGMCLGLVFALGQGAQTSHATDCHPRLTELLTKWCRASLPKTKRGRDYPFSSLQVNFNYAAIKHVDGNNIGPSYIQSIGSHSGGKLWTQDEGDLDCKDSWRLFDGNREHMTQPFQPVAHAQGPGERISFIAFAHGLYNKLDETTAAALKKFGFTAARTDGNDEEFFERFRIEKGYLSEAHNDAFRKALAERRVGENDPRTALATPGRVAIECYGRQAERGGGWMAFCARASADASARSAADVEVLELTPNTVGIWLAELAIDGATGALSLASQHSRIDFYKDVQGATRELRKRVDAMPEGTPVLLGIADTACARSRPLGQGAYAALALLGAPLDMPKIEYRAAWAMIGFKGAKPGDALTAMGTRSTLLRLDASFETRDGATHLTKHIPDLTSIIDVVTGGGQDEAVKQRTDTAPPDDDDQPAKKQKNAPHED